MNLHKDNKIFNELIKASGESAGIPDAYIEKDYWITMSLKFLSESPYRESVVFKGGTSLSKAYRLIDRFSEDIDLAVLCSSEKGDNQRKKLLKNVEKVVTQNLISLKGDERESKGSKFRRTVYKYPCKIDNGDFGFRSICVLSLAIHQVL